MMYKILFLLFIALAIALIIIAILAFSKSHFAPEKPAKKNYKLPYTKQVSLLTDSEKSFYSVLNTVVDGNQYHIFPKVRLADILSIAAKENWHFYFNRIQSKHVDFLLCDKESFKPILAIELDDPNQNSARTIARNEFVNNAYASADFPVLRIKSSYSYKPSDIQKKINNSIHPNPQSVENKSQRKTG